MQLREFVDTVTADEPRFAHSADDIITAGRRAERRRRTGLAAAGAAGLAVAAVAGGFALPSLGAEQADGPGLTATAATAPVPAFDFTYQGYDAGKFHVQDPIVVSTAYQMSSIYMDGRFTNDRSVSGEVSASTLAYNRSRPRLNAFLTVYRPGAFDPAGIKNAQTATVAGRRAITALLPAELDPEQPPAPGNKLLAWEYAADAWAVVTSQSNSAAEPSFAELETLVPGLRPSQARPATLPFTVGHVPGGYQPVQVGSHAAIGLGGINLARDGNYGAVEYTVKTPPTTGLTKPWEQGEKAPRRGETAHRGELRISVIPSGTANVPAEAGQTRCFQWHACNVWSADGKVLVEVIGTDLTDAELTRVARSVKVADVANDRSWTLATKAVRP
jgi:hypothetical protein